ncbi:rhomboid family intramembrane serine protease [Mesoflavibacter sp. CH_XMU1422-2]|uniref:rhomboid family intramembrane serine protease n=1 Tax=Mesoflavibacter sp. CH_XMU1422-2 TaxID=3107770 RepID=UPI00300BA9D7
MSQIDQLKYKYARLNVLEKVIVINVIIFLLALILNPIVPSVFKWLRLQSDFYDVLYKPWTIFTYGFVHFGLFHMIFNMLWLYLLGRIFMNLFNPKMALNIYFLGIIVGGLAFLFGYNVFSSFFSANAYLIGASGGVSALLIFISTYLPDKNIRFFTFNLKLWWIAVAFVAFDIIGLFGSNAGGSLAHLGGALLGFVYAKQLEKGNDIGAGFGRFMDNIASWFKPNNKSNLKTVHKTKSKVAGYDKKEFNELNTQKKIDTILDKISKSGYDSLTKEEKDFLFRAGK